MDFKEATDLLLGLEQRDIAEALGVEVQHLRQMRLSSDSAGHRNPPANWPRVLASLLRQYGTEHFAAADLLDPPA